VAVVGFALDVRVSHLTNACDLPNKIFLAVLLQTF
jgi:hypothetical protein